MKVNILEKNISYDRAVRKLLIIMPAYNEENNILKVLTELSEISLPIVSDLLVINDGSTDRTGTILSENGVNHISNIFNMGYGSCLQVGYKYAVRQNYNYLIQMDSDGQHDVENVRILYEALTKRDSEGRYPDLVLGSRFMEGSSPFEVGALKKFAYAWFRRLIRLITGYKEKIWDPTTGLQGMSRLAVKFYSIYGNFDSRFPDANMLAQMLLLGFKIDQVPAVMHQRQSGKSMHTGLLKQAFYMVHVTLSIQAVGIRQRKTAQDRKMVAWLSEWDTAPKGTDNERTD